MLMKIETCPSCDGSEMFQMEKIIKSDMKPKVAHNHKSLSPNEWYFSLAVSGWRHN